MWDGGMDGENGWTKCKHLLVGAGMVGQCDVYLSLKPYVHCCLVEDLVN